MTTIDISSRSEKNYWKFAVTFVNGSSFHGVSEIFIYEFD